MDKNSTLNFIGNESGFGNNNTSAYVELDDNFILIDCGFTVFNYLKNNFDFSKYNSISVIITHLHNDHAGSLSQFILYMWFVYNKKVTVISKCKNIGTYLKITGTTSEAYSIKDSSINVEFIETVHAKELDCYGFKARFNGKCIIYTGDTKTLTPYLNYMDDIDELYVDVSSSGGVHIKFEEIIDTLMKIKNAGVNIYLIHIDNFEYIKNINEGRFTIV